MSAETPTPSPSCRYIVLTRDETEYWSLDRLPAEERPDRILAVYFTSPDVGTYLCEMVPSLALERVENYAVWDSEVSDEVRERVNDWLLDGESHDVDLIYMHRSDVLAAHEGLQEFLDATEDGVSEEQERASEAAGVNGKATWAYVGSAVDGENEDGDNEKDDLFEYVRCNQMI